MINQQYGNGGVVRTTPVTIANGTPAAPTLDENGNTVVSGELELSGGLSLPEYDYVSMALSGGNTTETYTFKTGGSGGTTVATVVVVYTSSTRDVLSSVTKT